MGDQPGNTSRVRTSEDKVCRKDMCWSVRIVCVLVKLLDVSGPGLGEARRYRMVSEPTLAVSRASNGVIRSSVGLRIEKHWKSRTKTRTDDYKQTKILKFKL